MLSGVNLWLHRFCPLCSPVCISTKSTYEVQHQGVTEGLSFFTYVFFIQSNSDNSKTLLVSIGLVRLGDGSQLVSQDLFGCSCIHS